MSKRQTLVMHLNASLALAFVLALCAPNALAQKEAPASVSGRVREGERGVLVAHQIRQQTVRAPHRRFGPVITDANAQRPRGDEEAHGPIRAFAWLDERLGNAPG